MQSIIDRFRGGEIEPQVAVAVAEVRKIQKRLNKTNSDQKSNDSMSGPTIDRELEQIYGELLPHVTTLVELASQEINRKSFNKILNTLAGLVDTIWIYPYPNSANPVAEKISEVFQQVPEYHEYLRKCEGIIHHEVRLDILYRKSRKGD